MFSIVFVKNILDWHLMFLTLTLITMMIGTLGALYQHKLMRLFAYSSILHTGFLLIGCYLNSFDSFFFYFLTYSLTNISIFLFLLNLKKADKFLTLSTTTQITYLYKNNPYFVMCFVLNLFSLAGIPPLSGFFGKFFVIISLVEESYYYVSALILLISGLSCFYYLRLIKLLQFSNTRK